MSRAWVVFLMGGVLSWVGGSQAHSLLPAFGHTVSPRHAPQDAGAVVLGARQAGAALAFIQTLQYCGGPVPTGEEGLAYPRLMEYGQRMLSLNPYYRYGVLYVVGFLAFNNPINRPDQALALIAQAVKGDPKFWRYKMMAGAIGYTQDDRSEEAVALLEESIKDPDCPSMIKSILAGIHRKAGRGGRAAEIYESLLAARDKEYAERARKNLEDMMALGEIRGRMNQ